MFKLCTSPRNEYKNKPCLRVIFQMFLEIIISLSLSLSCVYASLGCKLIESEEERTYCTSARKFETGAQIGNIVVGLETHRSVLGISSISQID